MELAALTQDHDATMTDPATGVAGEGRDYDLHGMVAIRVAGASPGDLAALEAQFGPIAAARAREPDLVIRFVDRIDLSSPLRLLGAREAGYTEGAFLVLRGKHKASVRVEIPFDEIGGRCEITCERGLPAVPLLIPIVNLMVLAGGALPMHASAFRHQGTGVLVTGWARGGKTEVLLGFIAQGAEYIGDEWVYLVDGGRRVCGIPEPIRVWDWHLEDLPRFRRRLRRGARLRLALLRQATAGLTGLASRGGRPPAPWQRRTQRLADLLEQQRYVHLRPRDLFAGSFGSLQSPLHKVIFVASHASPGITVQRIGAEKVAERMAFSLQEERALFASYYRKYRFAFPAKTNPLLEAADAIERERLHRFLAGKECYAVYHPYPPSIPALVEAVRPIVES